MKTDPQKAIELYDQFEPGRNRSIYAAEVAQAVTAKDFTTAWEAYKSQRAEPAKRTSAGRIIGVQCCRGVERTWNAYLAQEPEPDKKLFLSNICISSGKRSTEDTIFALNMMRTVQSCAKCEAAFEVFASNQDGKDIHLLAAYLAAHPKVEKLDPAYGDLAAEHLKKKDPYEAAKWMSRMTCHRDDLIATLKEDLKNAAPKTRKAVTELVPEVAAADVPATIKSKGP
ncbi:MAG: hypothetical protein QM755_16815 [Luteolibacter sp.]